MGRTKTFAILLVALSCLNFVLIIYSWNKAKIAQPEELMKGLDSENFNVGEYLLNKQFNAQEAWQQFFLLDIPNPYDRWNIMIVWQSGWLVSLPTVGLTLWPSRLELWLATLSELSTQVRIPLGCWCRDVTTASLLFCWKFMQFVSINEHNTIQVQWINNDVVFSSTTSKHHILCYIL